MQRLAKGILGTHALRAFGKLMWEAAEQLQHQQQPGRRFLAGALDLMTALDYVMTPFLSESTHDLQLPLRLELRLELGGSGLMDHWARLMLLLSSRAGTNGVDASALAVQLHRTGFILVYNCSCQPELLREGPFLSYLASLYLVQLCAALDGGPVYGMPVQGTHEGAAALPAARAPLLPLLDAPTAISPNKATYFAEWVLFTWALVARESREELQADLRLGGSSGLAACPGAASPGPSSAAGGCGWRQERSAARRGAAAGRLRLPAARAGAVAEKALLCARMSFPELSDAASVPAWVHDRMAAYWRLLLRAAASPRLKDSTPDTPPGMNFGGMPWSDPWELVTDLHVPDTALHRLPPGPTPDVSAALSAGLLPAVERMLRRNDGPGLSLSSWPGGFAAYERAAAGWAQLLAFGPRDAVFSLLATAVKRMFATIGVTRESEPTNAAPVTHASAASGRALELLVSAAPLRWLVAQLQEAGPDAGAAARGEGPAEEVPAAADGDGGLSQLQLVASFVALLLVDLMMGVHGPVISAAYKELALPPVVPELLTWFPVIVTALDRRQPAHWGRLLAAALLHLAREEGDTYAQQLGPPLRRALWAVICQAPERVTEVLADIDECLDDLQDVVSKVARSQGRPPISRKEQMVPILQRVLGPFGLLPDLGLLAVLEATAAFGRGDRRRGEAVGAASGMAHGQQRRWSPPADVEPWLRVGKLLASSAEVVATLPRRCHNSLCTNMSGDSEKHLSLTVRCGCRLPTCDRSYCSMRCHAEDAVVRPHC
ncbi:hypothetical protein GPECTOR_67g287 [Gonium pectorale]|uniref:MYND-type domain-containing protein n=1 Tax=Gonium pectorale TaxID=33097 RepID=A0A150G3M2_GONPE|nr:hypothetical protein GPECTOR_67g287 [Gonium pectorale]|eukprot:KXZ44447.1 hypothetical protein GPECTOR_67g287 [Gonium pectorale]